MGLDTANGLVIRRHGILWAYQISLLTKRLCRVAAVHVVLSQYLSKNFWDFLVHHF